MTNDLIVNPYLTLEAASENASEFYLQAPKPNEGLQALKISQDSDKNLFEVFTDLSQTRFDFLDIKKDLSAKERDLLRQHGILVKPEYAPQKPFFACPLEEVETEESDIDAGSLVVNHSFRFEPFNLANFPSWLHEKHLSPYLPSAWIRSHATEIEIGYWLSEEEAAVVSKFIPGEKPDRLAEEKLIQKLVEAEILVSPEIRQQKTKIWNKKLSAAQEKFAIDKYAILRGLLPDAQMTAMRRFYHQYVEQGFMPFGDSQVEKRFRQHNEPFAAFMHKQFGKLMNLIVGAELKPSYVYAASYKEGATLTPHTDRVQCEYSISFQVDYQPEAPDHVSPWAIYVEPLNWPGDLPANGLSFNWKDTHREENPDAATAVYLASGDGLIYKGRELIHYRYALPPGHKSTSLFFHYVDADFHGNLQ